jgi:hypothetical protein
MLAVVSLLVVLPAWAVPTAPVARSTTFVAHLQTIVRHLKAASPASVHAQVKLKAVVQKPLQTENAVEAQVKPVRTAFLATAVLK